MLFALKAKINGLFRKIRMEEGRRSGKKIKKKFDFSLRGNGATTYTDMYFLIPLFFYV